MELAQTAMASCKASGYTVEQEVSSTPMLVVAALGLLVNLVCFGLLRAGAKESLNLRGAYLEVVADAVGSVGVLVAGAVIGRKRPRGRPRKEIAA